MDEGKVMVENKAQTKRSQAAGKEPRSVLGWVRKAVRRITRRKKKDLEIYPLF
jgi:hypothetical protein